MMMTAILATALERHWLRLGSRIEPVVIRALVWRLSV